MLKLLFTLGLSIGVTVVRFTALADSEITKTDLICYSIMGGSICLAMPIWFLDGSPFGLLYPGTIASGFGLFKATLRTKSSN